MRKWLRAERGRRAFPALLFLRLEGGAPTTNEELAAEIQRGRSDLYGQLWEQVKRFVAYKALRRYEFVQDRSGVDLEDLLQSAFLGLVAAVESFDPAGMASPFITTIVDALSLLVYFGIASALLLG